MFSAVLTGVIIPAQYFPLGQLDLRPWAMDHLFQSNNGRTRIYLSYRFNLTAPVQDQTGFPVYYEGNGTAGIADIDRLKIGVKNQYRRKHDCLQCREL